MRRHGPFRSSAEWRLSPRRRFDAQKIIDVVLNAQTRETRPPAVLRASSAAQRAPTMVVSALDNGVRPTQTPTQHAYTVRAGDLVGSMIAPRHLRPTTKTRASYTKSVRGPYELSATQVELPPGAPNSLCELKEAILPPTICFRGNDGREQRAVRRPGVPCCPRRRAKTGGVISGMRHALWLE